MIDIDNSNLKGNCELKCKYSFNYKDTITTVSNKKTFLECSHESTNPEPVTFNSKKYQVMNFTINAPSLHSYSGTKADAEITIVHYNNETILLVCIPIMIGVTNINPTLDTIITNAYAFINKNQKQIKLQQSINLTSFIPRKKFYTYNAEKIIGVKDVIVFNKNDDAYITISRLQYDNLCKLIKPNTAFKNATDVPYYVNLSGPNSGGDASNDGEIYIDCRPTSDNGEIIGGGENLVSKPVSFKKIDIKKITNHIAFKIIIGSLTMILLTKSYKAFLKSISEPKTPKIDNK
jgi:carbonic anhydrase